MRHLTSSKPPFAPFPLATLRRHHNIVSVSSPINMLQVPEFTFTFIVLTLTLTLTARHCNCSTAAAFAPAIDRALGSSSCIIRPRNVQLQGQGQLQGQLLSSNSSCSGSFFSQLQHNLVAVGTSAAIFAAALTSPINIHVNPAVPSNSININTSRCVSPMGINVGVINVSIERSEALALAENQQFVADAWFAVSAQFFDQTFNGLGADGWRAKEKEAMDTVADTGPDDDEIVTNAINTMLSALNDPYTRFLPREKYEALTAYATGGNVNVGGKNAGIGVQLLEDPRTKNVVVMATIPGSPAAAAGVQAGDAILKVDGESMDGATAEVVAAKCRGEAGGKIDIDFLRKESKSTDHLTLTRAKINANPIEASTFVSPGGKHVALLKVPSFSTETVTQMVNGLRSVSGSGSGDHGKIDAIAIDLRGNVGGYMPAGVDAAKLFLPTRAHIIAEVGKPGSPVKTYDADGIGAETSIPVYLLVDKRTASASEIFAAALQDNQRALVVGKTNSFGKGRIQNVQPLENGCGIAVTRARYVTPSGRDLHGVGIIPNKEPSKCEMNDSAQTCLADIVD